jgi:hypothetical protein
MPITNSIMWYDNGRFGEIGYAVPYIAANKMYSNNESVLGLVNKMGSLGFAIMHQPDCLVATPPTIFFLRSVGKAIDRINTILAAETIPSGQTEQRTVAVAPTPECFLIYPVPYWRVRNRWIKRWCKYYLLALAEAMKHQDNVFSLSIHPDLAGIVQMYTQMIYQQVAVEFLNVPLATVQAPGFVITDAMYSAYSPNSVFLLSERVDTGAPLTWNLATEDLDQFAQGVAAPLITAFLKDWPVPFVDPDPDATNIGAPIGTSSVTSQPSTATIGGAQALNPAGVAAPAANAAVSIATPPAP